MIKDNFLFFWGGTYSQWCPSDFTIEGIVYNTCEQYMMAKKALLFGDAETYTKIMAASNPRTQKALGRQVKGFDKDKWEAVCRDIVYNANYAKFTQNPFMKAELLATGSLEIVEASPEDKIWGIGLAEDNPLAWDRKTWQGTNWLGLAIMEVRKTLLNEFMSSLSTEYTTR
jgi:ribA/ribD-fused uncharacterized protein